MSPVTAAHLDDDLLVRANEAATLLLVSTRTLERWRADGVGPKPVKLGPRRIAYRLGDIREYIRAASSTDREPVVA